MELLNLPTEILRLVVEDSGPDDFESLALTCKLIFDIAKPLIEEHNRIKPYLSTSLGLDMASTKSCSRVFYDVLRDPTLTQYPQYLRCYMFHLDDPQTYHLFRDSIFIDILKKWIQTSPYLESTSFLHIDSSFSPSLDLDKWQQYLLEFIVSKDGSTSLPSSLLLLLPNLVEITLSDVQPPCEPFFLGRLMKSIGKDAVAGRKHPLSCLRTLYFSSSEDHEGVSLETLAPFIALPSMRKIVGHLLELGRGRVRYRWPYPAHTSNLEELHLNNSAIEDRDLKAFLQPMQKLRVFRHSHIAFGLRDERLRRGVGRDWSAAHTMQRLFDTVASPLEELSLTANCASTGALGFLRKLVRLKKVELDLRLLYEGEHNALLGLDSEYEQYLRSDKSSLRDFEPRLGAILPTSIKEIILMWDNIQPPWKGLFHSFSKHRIERLRQLEKITFRSSTRGIPRSGEIDDVVEELKSLGVQVVVEDVGDVDQIRPADHWEGNHYTDKERLIDVWAEGRRTATPAQNSYGKVRPPRITSTKGSR